MENSYIDLHGGNPFWTNQDYHLLHQENQPSHHPQKPNSPNQVLGGNRWILTFCFFFFPGGSFGSKEQSKGVQSLPGEDTGVFQIFLVSWLQGWNPNKKQNPLRLPPGNQPKIQIYERISSATSWLLINDTTLIIPKPKAGKHEALNHPTVSDMPQGKQWEPHAISESETENVPALARNPQGRGNRIKQMEANACRWLHY